MAELPLAGETRVPTWSETAKAAFDTDNRLFAAVSSEKLSEMMFPADPTPVVDADIDDRITKEGLTSHVDRFLDVRNRGQLEAKVAQIKREEGNKQILDYDGAGGTTALRLLAGAMDPINWIPGLGVGGTVAKAGYGVVKAASAGAAAAGVASAIVGEAVSHAVNELPTAEESAFNIAGGAIFGAVAGGTIAKLVSPKTAKTLGDGIKKELTELGDGTVAARIETNTNAVEVEATRIRTALRNGDELPEALGPNTRPSDLALANSFGVDTAVRKANDAGLHIPFTDVNLGSLGGNAVLDLANSQSPAVREAVFNLATVHSAVKGNEGSMVSVFDRAARIDGEHNIARKTLIDEWRSWSREQAKFSGFIERSKFLNTGLSLEDFSNAVFFARVYQGRLNEIPNEAMRTLVQNTRVQKAAAAYGKFDGYLAERSVNAGLLRKANTRENHVLHDYNKDVIGQNEASFVQAEADAAYTHHWTHQKAHADRALQQERDDIYETTLTSLVETQRKIDERAARTLAQETDTAYRDVSKATRDEHRTYMRDLHGPWYARRSETMIEKNQAKLNAALKKVGELVEAGLPIKIAGKVYDDFNDAVTRLEGQYTKLLHNAEVKLNKEFDDRLVARAEAISAKRGAEFKERVRDLRNTVMAKANKEQQAAAADITAVVERRVARAMAQHELNAGPEAQAALRAWADQHGDGVWKAIVHGDTGNSSHGRMTGGNIRGSNTARNVYTSTEDLLNGGYLNTDMLAILQKQARQQGIDSVVAGRFRRSLSPEEVKLAKRNPSEAYWLDGKDTTTVPDLTMETTRTRAMAEFKTIRDDLTAQRDALAPTDTSGVARINRQIKNLDKERADNLRDLDITMQIARNTYTPSGYGSGESLSAGLTALKALSYAAYMGGSVVTNAIDTTRLVYAHGVGQTLGYQALRMREKFTSLSDGKSKWVWNDFGRHELKEYAAASGFGMETYNPVRMTHVMGVADPYGQVSGKTGAERFADSLVNISSRAFLINHLTDAVKTMDYGMAMHRLSKLALSDVPVDKMSTKDKMWMQTLGLRDDALQALRSHFDDSGTVYQSGKPLRFDVRSMDPELGDVIAGALKKEVDLTITTPNGFTNPRSARDNPLLAAFLQFGGFSFASAMSTTNHIGQRFAAGDIRTPMVGLIAAAAVSYMVLLAKAYSSGDQQVIDRFWRAHDRNQGALWYDVVEKTGVGSVFSYLSNMAEGTVGIGAKSIVRQAFGDDVKDLNPLGRKKFEGKVEPIKTLTGAPGRFIADTGTVLADVAGSALGQSGMLPTMLTQNRITQRTVETAARSMPVIGAFYMRGIMDNYVVKPIAAEFPKHK